MVLGLQAMFCSPDLRPLVGPEPLDPSRSQLEKNQRLIGAAASSLSAPIYSQAERQKAGPPAYVRSKAKNKKDCERKMLGTVATLMQATL